MSMNKVIVTGGAGFIGSNLVERLLKDGAEEILIIDDFSTGKKENLHDSSKDISLNQNLRILMI